MSFFGSNPMTTPIGQLIEQATDGSLASENWTLNMEICDLINGSPEGPKDAVKAIKKRISLNVGKNYTVVLYTLTVLETCVKNCSSKFHVLIASKDFLQEFMKIISPKNDPPQVVQEKVLSLIQTWAEAFHGRPDMKEITKIYSDLKAKGVEFPMTDMDHMVPIHTPPMTQESSSPPPASRQPVPGHTAYPAPQQQQVLPTAGNTNGTIALQPDQLIKLRKELDVTQQNCRVFNDMLTEMKPGQEQPQDIELLQELNTTCRQMQQRIMELLGTVSNEDVTEELLRVNDYLNNVFIRYDRFERNRAANPGSAADTGHVDATLPTQDNTAAGHDPPAYAAASTGGVATIPNLIDLDTPAPESAQQPDPFSTNPADLQARLANMSLQAGTTASTLDTIPSTDARASAAPSIGDEEFDMFAQSRQSFDQGKQSIQPGSSTYQDQHADQFSGGLASAVQASKTEEDESLKVTDRPSDYDEMSRWLETGQFSASGAMEQPGAQESATSKEFDQFLATRAQEADQLPDIPTQNTRTGRQLQQDDSKDNALFAL